MSRPCEDLFTQIRRGLRRGPEFNPKVLTDTDCWEWKGHLDKRGRPCLRAGNPARLLYIKHFELQNPGIDTTPFKLFPERCENHLCVNPRHHGFRPIKKWAIDAVDLANNRAVFQGMVLPPLILPDDPYPVHDDDVEADLLYMLNMKDSGGWWNRPAQFWVDELDHPDFTLDLIQAAIDAHA